MTEQYRILIVELPREVAPLIEGLPPAYRSFYDMGILKARFPAERDKNGHWTVLSSDLPAIIAAMKLKPKASAAAPAKSPRRPSAAPSSAAA